MFSTKTKLAFGYIILIILLLGAIGYVYKQMNLLLPDWRKAFITAAVRHTIS